MERIYKIHNADNVAVALTPIPAGETAYYPNQELLLQEDIPAGHKVALQTIPEGEPITKYGHLIGYATEEILPGRLVHTHNLRSGLRPDETYAYTPNPFQTSEQTPDTFLGFRRADGRVGVRNEIWILPTVGCVNGTVQRFAQQAKSLVAGSLEGIYAFPHPYGCGQPEEDHMPTLQALTGLIHNPNAAAVLVVGLGCEFTNVDAFRAFLGDFDSNRIQFMVCQESEDEYADAFLLLERLALYAKQFQREPIPLSELIVGLKCGGSDGFSGITANPLLGVFSDKLVSQGGTTLLTEVPEMFGAEKVLMNRCENPSLFDATVCLINDCKARYLAAGHPVHKNPSPGNLEGGITTLDEKSLGCLQKGGTSRVTGVLQYGQPVTQKGLNLVSAPGYDLVSASALAIAGAQMVLFTSGRGTPFSAPVPTVKIASNSAIAQHKKAWFDFDAGRLIDGAPMEELSQEFWQLVIDIASGKMRTKAEMNDFRELDILHTGLTT